LLASPFLTFTRLLVTPIDVLTGLHANRFRYRQLKIEGIVQLALLNLEVNSIITVGADIEALIAWI
jgi:hypothetical protein